MKFIVNRQNTLVCDDQHEYVSIENIQRLFCNYGKKIIADTLYFVIASEIWCVIIQFVRVF